MDSLTDIDAAGVEVNVQTNSTTNALNQAYTCVKIITDTPDYLGELAQDNSKLIPLIGVSSFDKIKIEWFSSKDLPSSALVGQNTSLLDSGTPLLNKNDWPANRPPIMRAQIIQFGPNFKLSDFDDSGTDSFNNTSFLYPSSNGSSSLSKNSSRKSATFSPNQIGCKADLANEPYSCSVTIELNAKVSAGAKNAYLSLGAIYNKANYRVTLINSSTTPSQVDFKNVQPSIDSTGRANDYFKRVSTRVEMSDTNFPYPVAEIAINGNFCKDFIVTDNAADYVNGCVP